MSYRKRLDKAFELRTADMYFSVIAIGESVIKMTTF